MPARINTEKIATLGVRANLAALFMAVIEYLSEALKKNLVRHMNVRALRIFLLPETGERRVRDGEACP